MLSLAALLLVTEFFDPQLAMHHFGERAVKNPPNAYCRALVTLTPFWSDRPLYATKMTPDDQFIYYYYFDHQEAQKQTVQNCRRLRDLRLSHVEA